MWNLAERIIKTCVLFLTSLILAINAGIIAVTLPDMELRTSSNTAEMSLIFIWTGIATIVGTLLIGPLYDYINGMLLLSVNLLLVGFFTTLGPMWPSLGAYQTLMALMIAFCGAAYTGCLTIIRNLWKKSVKWMPPAIQMTFQMHVVGAAISTQIVKPFLGGDEQVHSNITFQTTDNSTSDPMQTLYQLVGGLDAIMAFMCMLTYVWSCFTAGRCCIGVAVCLRDADDNEDLQLIPDSTDSDPNDAQSSRTRQVVEPCSLNGYILLSIIYVFLLMIYAHDFVLKYLLFTYVYEYLGWSVGDGTILLFMYYVTRFVIGSLVVPLSHWVSPTYLLVFNLTTMVVAGSLMLVAVELGGTFTVIGVILSAVGSCNVSATTLTLIEETTHVVAAVMSVLLSTTGFAKFGVSFTGTLLYYAGEASYPATILVLSTVSLLMFVFYKVFCRVITSPLSGSVKSNDAKQPVTTAGIHEGQ